jgi:hypothetical protein
MRHEVGAMRNDTALSALAADVAALQAPLERALAAAEARARELLSADPRESPPHERDRTGRRAEIGVALVVVALLAAGAVVATRSSSDSGPRDVGAYIDAHIVTGTAIGVVGEASIAVPAGRPVVAVDSLATLGRVRVAWVVRSLQAPPSANPEQLTLLAWLDQVGVRVAADQRYALDDLRNAGPPPGASADSSGTASPVPSTVGTEAAGPLPRTVEVRRGDSFWSIAAELTTEQLGRAATVAEIDPVWRALIASNLDQLPHPGNPSKLYIGTVLTIPP